MGGGGLRAGMSLLDYVITSGSFFFLLGGRYLTGIYVHTVRGGFSHPASLVALDGAEWAFAECPKTGSSAGVPETTRWAEDNDSASTLGPRFKFRSGRMNFVSRD